VRKGTVVKEVGGDVGEGVGHRAAAELWMERRRVRLSQGAGRDGVVVHSGSYAESGRIRRGWEICGFG